MVLTLYNNDISDPLQHNSFTASRPGLPFDCHHYNRHLLARLSLRRHQAALPRRPERAIGNSHNRMKSARSGTRSGLSRTTELKGGGTGYVKNLPWVEKRAETRFLGHLR